MIKRDTERHHELANSVFSNINIYDMQGLLINSHNQFSAAIEAFELDSNELFNLNEAFSEQELKAKYILAKKLNIPFFIITYNKGTDFFTINEIAYNSQNSSLFINKISSLNFSDFVTWWGRLKGTLQTKELFEAANRTKKIDEILEKHGLSWGGNVDGFILSLSKDETILGIVEKRLSHKYNIENYDPANFFHYRGGDYNTWLPLITLSKQLNCPLFLMTFNINDNKNFGLAVVDNINGGLNYRSATPNENIFNDISKAKKWMSNYMNL